MKAHFFCTFLLSIWTAAKAEPAPGPDYRLPTSLTPLHYSLRLRPIIDRDYPGIGDKNTARGLVRITLQCVESTRQVVMHQRFLNINESFIGVQNLEDNTSVGVTGVEYDEVRDFLTVSLTSDLTPPSCYEVTIGYWARVPASNNDSFNGMYVESYLDPLTNQTQLVAATQLAPVSARKLFPCLDEPSYKVTFDVVIGRTENFTSLSNGQLIETQPDSQNPGWFWDTYATTVPMPTYLVALAVFSDFTYHEAPSDLYRLPVRIYGARHLITEGRADLSTNTSAMLMSHFEKKYGVPYPMSKVYSLALPYKRGGMENYGLIKFGEDFLMYHEGVTLDTKIHRILWILAHELGHQWFGNLVTCQWWSDVWLNEGIASYVSFEGAHAIRPEFDMMTFMVHDMVNIVLKYDATSRSLPLHQEVYSEAQIVRNFGTIGYEKGGSIVRMMVSFLGEDVFYSGLTTYLERHQNQVVTQYDLFAALNEAVISNGPYLPRNVSDIMDTWTLQKGFPLVRVRFSESDNNIVLSQEPWQNADVRNNESDVVPDSVWDIPVKYLVQNGGLEGDFWLLQNEENVTMQTGNGWILVNSDAGGYYRTWYDDRLATEIIAQLAQNHSVFPAAGRVRLLDDQFILGAEEYAPITNGLEFTKYLGNETDPTVWMSTFSNLLKLRRFYGEYILHPSFTALKNYLLPKVDSAREQVEKILSSQRNLEASAVSILYSELVDWSCALDSLWCWIYTEKLFDNWTASPEINPVPLNLQSTMYCKIVQIFESPGYNLIFEQYQKPGHSATQKSKMAVALGCSFFDLDGVMRGIEFALERDSISAADSIALLQQFLRHSKNGRAMTLAYMTFAKRWIEEYGWTVEELVQVISAGTSYFAQREEIVQLEDILENAGDVFQDSLNATITAVQQNVDWIAEYDDIFIEWFNANSL